MASMFTINLAFSCRYTYLYHLALTSSSTFTQQQEPYHDSSMSSTYLITGANRGIGKGLTVTLLQRPNSTVIAGVRDPAASATTLNSLPTAAGSRIVVVKIDSQSETDAKEAISLLRTQHSITSLDIVIANAGIAHSGTTVAQTSSQSLRDHLNTNTIGPVLLF